MNKETEKSTSTVEAAPRLLLSVSPHIRSQTDVQVVMYWVVVALVPAMIWSVYVFGIRTLWLTLTSILTAVLVEALFQKVRGRPITVHDGSAIITGILLAYNVPPGVPYWLVVVGSASAIGVKQIFGGLGYNIWNPALLGRAVIMASWPVHMTTEWLAPKFGTLSGIDAVSSATPLSVLKEAHRVFADPTSLPQQIAQVKLGVSQLYSSQSLANLFWGNVGGCIGEVSVALLLLGAILLFAKKIIDWRIPITYVGTVAVLGWIFGGAKGFFTGNVLFQVMAGGLILGAFYMATDMVTSPITRRGRLFFGVGCGIITVIIRAFGGYPEGVSYSILLMNATTPLIDHWTSPKKFGSAKQRN
ncbi:RnfABCDGE type electron transport complex subunit D [candidate division TA06 bacterium]|uniref:Ion-translocating oxidoreductase complex subunit D n=1 Tax=candidate division TA06 bacterium TaxID=2250710 RepID=A0A523XP74_UNCT6|nr:MAG: RnfABCDGE type electron transport complex subunit D [candidate division TA06 bacterium]